MKLGYKQTKQAVDYSRGMPKSHCGICRHFQPPSTCEKVAGKIDPAFWCKLYAPKEKK